VVDQVLVVEAAIEGQEEGFEVRSEYTPLEQYYTHAELDTVAAVVAAGIDSRWVLILSTSGTRGFGD
jgi:hypothetical protein